MRLVLPCSLAATLDCLNRNLVLKKSAVQGGRSFHEFLLRGCPTLFGKGPQRLLRAGSWAALLKITIIVIPNHLSYFENFDSICTVHPT